MDSGADFREKLVDISPPQQQSELELQSMIAIPTNALNDREYDDTLKIVIVGDCGVGKTQLVSRYAHGQYGKNMRSTIGVDFASKYLSYNDRKIKVQLWDTTGNERYRAITSAYYRGAVGALVVYDITRKATFDHSRYWLEELQKYSPHALKVLLVGNKLDKTEERETSIETVEQFTSIHGIPFTETSAKDDVNIDTAFKSLILSCLKDADDRESTFSTSGSSAIQLGAEKLKQESRCSTGIFCLDEKFVVMKDRIENSSMSMHYRRNKDSV